MESLRHCGGPRSAVGCLVSYFVAAAAAGVDIGGVPESDELNCRRGTSYGLPGISERSWRRRDGVVPTECCVGFPYGTSNKLRVVVIVVIVVVVVVVVVLVVVEVVVIVEVVEVAEVAVVITGGEWKGKGNNNSNM